MIFLNTVNLVTFPFTIKFQLTYNFFFYKMIFPIEQIYLNLHFPLLMRLIIYQSTIYFNLYKSIKLFKITDI